MAFCLRLYAHTHVDHTGRANVERKWYETRRRGLREERESRFNAPHEHRYCTLKWAASPRFLYNLSLGLLLQRTTPFSQH